MGPLMPDYKPTMVHGLERSIIIPLNLAPALIMTSKTRS
ncbi:uncharacterized protein G2W53_012052 [Senna tora]|uniref:Uncharacterized protein n=1 Tax=Senna tora TaxID=362788 RepID=A0A834TXF7_9FABA|nr:uncharacterized protein G2W53_012052 [Senna tora]